MRVFEPPLLLLLAFTPLVTSQECIKDIPDDICPQHEGFDVDCERRCLALYPLRISSGCQLRATGTLLSFFGIRSFACRCTLPASYCDATAVLNALSPARLHFSMPAIQAHSTIERLQQQEPCPLSPSSFDLACSSSFAACGWRRSQGSDWFTAREHGIMPFAKEESPSGEYLVAISKEGFMTVSIDTCAPLCSTDDVTVSVRVWRAPWVVVELCFKEAGASMCAPILTPNGRITTETIPQTNDFSISFRFSNLTGGDAVLIDDLSANFTPCPLRSTAEIAKPLPIVPNPSSFPSISAAPPPEGPPMIRPAPGSFHASMVPSRLFPPPMQPQQSFSLPSPVSLPPSLPPQQFFYRPPPPPRPPPPGPAPVLSFAAPSSMHHTPSSVNADRSPSQSTQSQSSQIGFLLPEVVGKTSRTSKTIKKHHGSSEACKDGDCRPLPIDRTCIGRAAAIKCQAKCRHEQSDGKSARCLREAVYPFMRRCVCGPRRSPGSVQRMGISMPTYSTDSHELERVEGSYENLPALARHSRTFVASSGEETHEVDNSLEVTPIPSTSPPPSPISSSEISLHDEDELSNALVQEHRQSLLEAPVLCFTNATCAGQCDAGSDAICRNGECICSKCASHMCDFEQRGECGWSDLRVLSAQFNNISVAAKKGTNNRYGLSRMAPRSYSGLLRKSNMAGPIALSVDLFPSHALDVRICVHTLQTCQSQRVEARAWNRVTAKIRMKRTDKLFLLFYNKAGVEKTVAIDNIHLLAGQCEETPVRRRRV